MPDVCDQLCLPRAPPPPQMASVAELDLGHPDTFGRAVTLLYYSGLINSVAVYLYFFF